MAEIDTNSESQPNPMNISLLVSPPDSTKINSNTIIKRVHGLCTWVRFSPQRRERFAIAVHSCQPELHERKVKGLEIDVPTRWNSTYSMFQRAPLLQKSCNHFCKQNSEAGGFSLSPAEWDHAVVFHLRYNAKSTWQRYCEQMSTCTGKSLKE